MRRASDGEGLVVRFYNLEREPVEARVTTSFPIQAAHRLNLAEERQETLAVQDRSAVAMPMRGAEIMTIEVQTKYSLGTACYQDTL